MVSVDMIGLSTASLAGYSLDRVLASGTRLGFSSVEILGFEGERHSQGDLCGFAFAERGPGDVDALRASLSAYGRISVHAPFIFVPLLTANPGIQREALRQVESCIQGIGSVGGTSCTIHLNGVPFWSAADVRAASIRILCRLGDTGAQHGVRIALETGFPNDEDDYCSLIEKTDHPYVGACIDTGHIFNYYAPELRGTPAGIRTHNDILNRIIARLGRKIAVCHLHDNRAHDFRDHRAPGRGIIDWKRALQTMDDADCNCPLLLELEETDLEAALVEGRQHLLDRFAG